MRIIVTASVRVAALPFVLLSLCGCNEFAKQNRRFAETAFNHDFKGYTFLDTPGGTNVIGTMRSITPNVPFSNGKQWGAPEDWFDSSVSPAERASILKSIVKDGPLGTARFQQTVAKKIDVNATLPGIKQAISADISADLTSDVSVDIEATDMIQREVNYFALCTAKGQGKFNKFVSDLLASGSFQIVQDTLVYGGFRMKVDASRNSTVSAKLKAAAAAAKVVGQDAGLNLSVSDDGNSHYSITDNDPVVVAYYVSAPIDKNAPLCPSFVPPPGAEFVLPRVAQAEINKSAKHDIANIARERRDKK